MWKCFRPPAEGGAKAQTLLAGSSVRSSSRLLFSRAPFSGRTWGRPTWRWTSPTRSPRTPGWFPGKTRWSGATRWRSVCSTRWSDTSPSVRGGANAASTLASVAVNGPFKPAAFLKPRVAGSSESRSVQELLRVGVVWIVVTSSFFF